MRTRDERNPQPHTPSAQSRHLHPAHSCIGRSGGCIRVGILLLAQPRHQPFLARAAEHIGAWWWPLAVCLVGGVAIGLFERRFGAYPEDLNKVMTQVKETGRYEYKHIGASAGGALLPLLFGGSVGPEAGLTGVIAGLCTWVGDRLKFLGKEFRELSQAGTAAVLSARVQCAFVWSGGAASWQLRRGESGHQDRGSESHEDHRLRVCGGRRVRRDDPARKRVWRRGRPAAFLGGLHRLVRTRTHHSAGASGGAVGLLYHAFDKCADTLARKIGDHPVAKAVLVGLILGSLGIVFPFVMFAGETQTETLMSTYTMLGAGYLIFTGVLKVFTTPLCLRLGWRGGHFFPTIFAGICLGYGFALLTGADPVCCLCICSAALMGAIMRQPVMTVLLLFLLFPVRAFVVMLVAACIGAALTSLALSFVKLVKRGRP